MKNLLTFFCAALFMVASCSENEPQNDNPGGGQPILSNENQMPSFALDISSQGSKTKYHGTIDHRKGRISVNISGTGWIDNITEVTAEFTITGESVEVDGTEQISGSTKNNFMKNVVYTVIAESGAERSYTVDVIAPQASGLPVVRIDTQGGAPILDKENYVTSTFTITDPNDPGNDISAAAAGVRGRGNTTWWYEKKPYRVKLDKKASVFGLTSAKNWVLLANWQDPTFLMNSVGFELSRRVGLDFSPTTTNVELFLNGEYKGNYTVCEHIQVNEGRVDIDEFQDVFLEIDTYYDEPYKFRSNMLELPVMIKSPEFEGVADTERDKFIADVKTDFDEMEQAVMSLTGWREKMDVASFINFMIVNELTRNIELGHPKSTYLYKKRGGKWTWGPVWDLDWAYGYIGGGQDYWSAGSDGSMLYIKGLGFNEVGVWSEEAGARFFAHLFRDAGFKEEFKARWREVKPLIGNIDEFVEEMSGKLTESEIHNKRVWVSQYQKSYSGEVASMRAWLKRRVEAMDAEIAKW